MNIVCIYREQRFSPSSVEKDKAIMDAVASGLRTKGHDVSVVEAESLRHDDIAGADTIFSMARDSSVLAMLEMEQKRGAMVINSPYGISLCTYRSRLDELLRQEGIAVPPQHGPDGVWVKRGDGSAEIKDDVVLCHSPKEIEDAIDRMRQRGITSWIQQAHIPGDLVKFYGVAGELFSFSYPTDSGHSKFGLESANGAARHYAFDANALQHEAEKISSLTGVTVYGGDAVVTASGGFFIIDFNDWPTFSSCRDAAADAIVHYSGLTTHN